MYIMYLTWDLAHSKCSINVSNSQSRKENFKVTKVRYDTKTTSNKRKSKLDFIKTKCWGGVFLYIKGQYQESKNKSQRMGENI